MDEQRRYADEPDPLRYTGGTSYDPGLYQRPDDAYRLPGDSGAGYTGRDGSASAFSFGAPLEPPGEAPPSPRSALDAIRVPLRPTEYPVPRPSAEPAATAAAGPTTAAPTVPPLREPGSFGALGAAEQARPDPLRPEQTRAGVPRPEQSAFPPPGTAAPDGPGTAWPEPDRLPSDRLPSDRPQPERAASRRGGDTVYRSRRPASAVIFAIVTALLLVPAVRLLVDAAFADAPTARGIVPAVLLVLGLPLTGAGLYGVSGAGGAVDRGVFLRPPAGYLPVGLVLLVAAGLAVA